MFVDRVVNVFFLVWLIENWFVGVLMLLIGKIVLYLYGVGGCEV